MTTENNDPNLNAALRMVAKTGLSLPIVTAAKDFAVRFFSVVRVETGPHEHHYVFLSRSMAAAKSAAKLMAKENGWRLVSVDKIPDDERENYRINGWYVNTVDLAPTFNLKQKPLRQ